MTIYVVRAEDCDYTRVFTSKEDAIRCLWDYFCDGIDWEVYDNIDFQLVAEDCQAGRVPGLGYIEAIELEQSYTPSYSWDDFDE